MHALIDNREIWRVASSVANLCAVCVAGIKLGAQLNAMLPRPL